MKEENKESVTLAEGGFNGLSIMESGERRNWMSKEE